MRLTVLGCSGTHPGPQRLCSSYLVEHGGYRLLLDCGNGSLSNLLSRIDVADLDQVLITHLHPDHFADLYGLYYALRFHPSGPLVVPLLGPRGTTDFVTRLLPGESGRDFAHRLPARRGCAGQTLELGPLRVALFAATHPVETLAPRIEAGGSVLAYSADSAPGDDLVACARDADLFVCDSTWSERARPLPQGVHSTGAEAGRTAAEAGVARLLVTHVAPENDADEIAEEARGTYDGEVLVAHDLDVLEL